MLKINPGMALLIPSSRVVGGKKQKRQIVDAKTIGERYEEHAETFLVIADKAEHKRATAIVQEATHAIRSRSALTPIGYLSDASVIAEVSAEYARIKGLADAFNASAKHCHVSISWIPMPIAMAITPDAAKAIADHVREELTDLRKVIGAGDQKQIRAILLRAKNLPALAVGTQSDAIRFAIEDAKTAQRAINERVANGETPESAGRSVIATGLPMMDAAIETFTHRPDDAGALPAGDGAPALPAGTPDPDPLDPGPMDQGIDPGSIPGLGTLAA